MPLKTFQFPEQDTANGDSIKFDIYYENGSTVTTAVDNLIWSMSTIKFQFEIPSNNGFRHSALKITVHNIDDDFESNSIYSSTYHGATFIKIYKNSSLYWHGRVVWDKSKKKKWFKEGATVTYRQYQIYCVDILEYMQYVTLATASTDSTERTVELILDDICTHFGITTLVMPSYFDWLFTEDAPASGYVMEAGGGNIGLSFVDGDFSISCLTFISELCLSMGLFVVVIEDTMTFTKRNDGTASEAISNDDIISVDKITTYNDIDYISMTAKMQFETDYGVSDLGDDYPVTRTTGTLSGNPARNFEISPNNVLPKLGIAHDAAAATYPSPSHPPTGVGVTFIVDTGEDFLDTDFAAPGMVANYNNFANESVIVGTVSTTRINFLENTIPSTGSDYFVDRKPGNGVFKFWGIMEYVKAIYADYFQPEMLNMHLIGFKSLTKKYTWDSNTYKPAGADIDLLKGTTKFIFREMA